MNQDLIKKVSKEIVLIIVVGLAVGVGLTVTIFSLVWVAIKVIN